MATPPDRTKMRNNPVNGKKKKRRKAIKGILMDQPTNGRATTQATPRVAGTPQPLVQTFTTKTPYSGKTTKVKIKKALPLSKSRKGVRKGSPRTYENVKKSKPLGKNKRKNGRS